MRPEGVRCDESEQEVLAAREPLLGTGCAGIPPPAATALAFAHLLFFFCHSLGTGAAPPMLTDFSVLSALLAPTAVGFAQRSPQ